MAISIAAIDPARPDFAGEVSGIDLAAPITPADAAAIDAGMARFAVLVFRDQRITDEQQVAFSRHFGPLEEATGDLRPVAERRISMALNDISNLDQSGKVMARDDRRRLFSLGNMLWHSDSSFKAAPARYSLLSARVIPGAGGNTEFADMRAAYDALDDETKAMIQDLVCEHSQIYSRGALGFTEFTEQEMRQCAPVKQRLVRRHPVSGRKSLFLSAHIGAIDGMPVPEARMLIRDLTEHATQREFVYAHVWRPFDLVMWDNRATMHRARRYDATQVRDMRRTTVSDEVSTLEQVA
ncbi:TauD/TfdA dioxygenase family protein [Elioraea rosea]|uniref:TauD/TfdA dioxygenase family protein n=1 Tax=Elioraea rosea TaxID=2492390 RepID=UPI0011836898|nr:TauD/TfdA family dioxygenase [Elioraea rosea]